MTQKGGIALFLLILVLVIALSIGAFYITQNTSFFSNAGSAQMTIPYDSLQPSPKSSPKATPATSAYENPFEATSTNDNPFEESYENPFNNL